VVPVDWKKTNICPIYKKGSRNLTANYRPVCLAGEVCKVFETLVRDVIVKHLEEKQLLRDTQRGLRKGRSCPTNLLSFLDKVARCVDDGHNVKTSSFLILLKPLTKFPILDCQVNY